MNAEDSDGDPLQDMRPLLEQYDDWVTKRSIQMQGDSIAAAADMN